MLGFVFPGQGSQYSGMGKQLIDTSDKVRIFFEYLSDYLEIDLKEICCDLSEEELRQTENAQIAIYAYSIGLFEVIKEKGFLKQEESYCFAGHSVGEYAALTAAGVLSIEEGAALVYRRGQIMAETGEAHLGGMAAVIASSVEIIREACNTVKGDNTLVIANYNSPMQVVVSGEIEALNRLSAQASELNLKKVIPLNVSGAFHSPLMQKSSTMMSLLLMQARFHPTKNIVLSNVTGDRVDSFLDWSHLLEHQLSQSVLWCDEVKNMVNYGVDQFIEIGPGQVLSGLIKRIVPNSRVCSLQTLDDIKVWDNYLNK